MCRQLGGDKEGTVKAGDYNIGYGKRNENHQKETGYFVHNRVESSVKRVMLVSDRGSYIVLRGRLFNIIVLNLFCNLPTPAFFFGGHN